MKVTIYKDGTQKIEALGAEGPSCVEFTQALEKRLGHQVGERELKPEYYQQEREVERLREKER